MPDQDVTISATFSRGTLPFTDVKTTDWFYDAVSFTYNMGIMDGVETNKFSPPPPSPAAWSSPCSGAWPVSPTPAAYLRRRQLRPLLHHRSRLVRQEQYHRRQRREHLRRECPHHP